MNFFGIATGTDTYALSVSERSELRPGDIVTVVFLHDNTGASTLNVNGFGPVPLLRNASAMSAGDLVASTTYQFCYTGASFVQDVQASAGATTDASLLTSGTLAAARLPSNINAANLADGSVSNTELQYINSVTSNVQSQLDNKAALSHSHAASDITSGTIATARLGSGTADSTTFLCGDQTYRTVGADEIAAAMAGEDLDLENLGLHGGYGNIAATIAQMLFDHSYSLGSYEFRCNSSRVGGFPLAPSDMPYSAVGATFANDGNWYNLYSLAQGTHNGEIKIACALFGGLVTFTINGTSISLINDGWGGSYADTTAASGKIAFRVSGGYLQINVGTGISSTPRKFLAIFNGTVN